MSETDDTPPMGMRPSDRVALDMRIDSLQAKLDAYVLERKDQAYAFYLTRMIPLDRQVASNTRVVWFTLGAVGCFVVGLTILIVLLLLRAR